MKKLELINLNVQIDNKLILKDINLEFESNKVYLIVGPNGHGKSTLLKTIFKHYSTTISSGEIKLNNEVINDLSTDQIARKGLYLVTQSPVEIPGLKTLDLLRNEMNLNKEKNIKILDLYKDINNKIKHLGLNQQILNRNINQDFSGGEKKKLEILQLQLLNPDFIFLDEVDSGLDVSALNTISEILQQHRKNGKSIVYISHNDKLALNIKPDYVILLVDGKVVEIGDINLSNRIIKEGYDWVYREYNLPKVVENSEFEEFYCHAIK